MEQHQRAQRDLPLPSGHGVLWRAAALSFLGAAALFAQTETGVIYGRVTNSRGQAQNVMVRLYAEGDLPAGNMYTDAQGQFAFQALPGGEYWVVVEAEGFRPLREHARLDATISPRAQVNAVLEPVTAAAVNPNPIVSGSTSSHIVDAKKPAPDFNPKALREFDKGNKSRQNGDFAAA